MPPAAFWDETPRSFITIMKGAALAAKRSFDRDIALAWHTGGFTGAAQAGKLKRLERYLKQDERPVHSPHAVLSFMRELQMKGVPVDIRKLN